MMGVAKKYVVVNKSVPVDNNWMFNIFNVIC